MKFQFQAINTDGAAIPCAILADDELLLGPDGQPRITPFEAVIDFSAKPAVPAGASRTVKLEARGLLLDPKETKEKKVIRGLAKGDRSLYLESVRWVYPSDAPIQLFILARGKG